MALQVEFYQHTKRINSTKLPGSSDPGERATYQCVLKDGCSQLHPVLEIRYEVTPVTAPDFNYAHISDFHRWYWVNDWVYDRGIWIAYLDVDVLGSYRSEIGAQPFYCLRSNYENDDSITDTLYPIKNTYTYGQNQAYLVPNVNSGRYVVGVIGAVGNNDPYGGISYMQLTPAQFSELKQSLFADDLAYAYEGNPIADTGLEELGASLAKLLFKPFDYIVSCCWIPQAAPVAARTTHWKIGFWYFISQQGQIEIINPTNSLVMGSVTLAVPKRNDVTRGKYAEAAPFTEMQMFIPTVGLIPLDTEKLVNVSQIYVTYYTDPISQKSFVQVLYDLDSTHRGIIGCYPAGYVVPIALAQSGVTIASTAAQAIGNSISLMAPIAGGIGAASEALSMAKGAISSAQGLFAPTPQMTGDDGSFSTLLLPTQITAFFWDIADQDRPECGRPLCKTRKPEDIPGFFQALHGDATIINATAAERDEIKKFLENGFFYQ
jgi:hypothetical protein